MYFCDFGGCLILRRFDRSKPVDMTENERRGELAALLSRALCRMERNGRETSRNPASGPCCGPENAAQCDSLVNNPEIDERVT
jgi:hypothetical protein